MSSYEEFAAILKTSIQLLDGKITREEVTTIIPLEVKWALEEDDADKKKAKIKALKKDYEEKLSSERYNYFFLELLETD